ncbi:MAG: LysM domain-containing protein [Deltaproteobacteria bacterium]|nr:LysM domain-containing protein [Deltaproteobacteria bacterium]
MSRFLSLFSILTIFVLFSGCAYFQKKDEPPPLPPIEEVKPPLTMKGEYFKSFPWSELQSPKKDGNDPETMTVTVKEGETLDSIAETMMGNPSLAGGLATYNKLSSPNSISSGEKIVIPYPIIGVKSQIMLKAKGVKAFSEPQNYGTPFKKGDEYKLRFETNVNGNLYVFRKGVKGVAMLYPAQLKKGKRNKNPEPLMRDSEKVTAYDPVMIPIGKTGFAYNPKNAGDMLYIFLSLRKIAELEDLKTKPTMKVEDIEDVMHRVKEGEIKSDPPLRLLRTSDPSEVIGFTLNIDG